MKNRIPVVLVGLTLFMPLGLIAQTGEGTLVGSVTDVQKAVLPGVSVTATSPVLIGERSAISDETGYYRLRNLPPGGYTLTAQLPGFATLKRTGLLVRAGATFTVNVEMQVSAASETINVTAESPMVETSAPISNVLVSGEFQREIPLNARRNWADVLEMSPAVYSRPFDDNSGRQVYHGRATGHWTHVIQVDGANAVSYYDAQPTFINMSTEEIGDVEMKTGGVDAASPMGTGIVVNIVTPSGGNQFHGSASSNLQPLGWNGNNTKGKTIGGVAGNPTIQQIYQWDGSFGGPIKKDKIWFFSTVRVNRLTNAISRTAENVTRLAAFRPDFDSFNNHTRATQWFVKGTMQLNPKHNLLASWSDDRVTIQDNGETQTHATSKDSTGGSMYNFKLDSIWTSKLSTTMLFSYNNKSGHNADTYKDRVGFGPQVTVHQNAFQSGGVLVGTGVLSVMNNLQSLVFEPASLMTIRSDFTYFMQAGGGSHEFKWGFYGAPRNRYDQTRQYLNNGFVSEVVKLKDPNNLKAGFVPFQRTYVDPIDVHELSARERDLAFYVQDSWKPGARLTISGGVRVDFAKRDDKIFNITRQKSAEIGPRFGFAYLLDRDGNNVIRGSYTRTHQPMTGRDNVTRFLGGGSVNQRVLYDLNSDGIFETENFTPAATQTLVKQLIDPKLSQPFTDEVILGYRRQFPGQISIDVAGTHKKVKRTNALVEVNGYWPDAPNKPFGGFGRIDPNRGQIFMQTENTWSRMNVNAVDLIFSKNMSHGFTALGTYARQWHWLSGSWNPNDPARFIQPAAFKLRNVSLYDTRGNNENDSLSGGNIGSSIWMRGSFSAGWSWHAPLGIVFSGSFTARRTFWAGPIVDRIASADPRFGPARITLANGTTQPNPLATTIRFAYPTRTEGFVPTAIVHPLGLKIGRDFKFGDNQKLELGANILNILNEGDFYQFASGANQKYSPNFLTFRSQQPARAVQALVKYKF